MAIGAATCASAAIFGGGLAALVAPDSHREAVGHRSVETCRVYEERLIVNLSKITSHFCTLKTKSNM